MPYPDAFGHLGADTTPAGRLNGLVKELPDEVRTSSPLGVILSVDDDVDAGPSNARAVMWRAASSSEMLSYLTIRWNKQSKLVRGEIAGFCSRLYERWKKPLELLGMLHTMCLELGTSINAEIARSPIKPPYLFDV